MLKKRKPTTLTPDQEALLTDADRDLMLRAEILHTELIVAGLHGTAALMHNAVKYIGFEMGEVLKRRQKQRRRSERTNL